MAKVAYGANVSNIRGKIGTDVFTKAHSGPTLRILIRGKNPKTTPQSIVRLNLARAAAAFRNMTPAQVASWSFFAQTITKHNPVNGVAYSPTAVNEFVALATKFLQVNPGGVIPLTPPATSFAGDTITVTALGGAGQVAFTASGANSPNVKTELLLQPLRSRNRVPAAKGYRSKGFVAFVAGALTQNVPVTPAGFYVPAFRFVNTLTGQATTLIVLAVVQVN
jgi:hypothetical protein